MNIVRNCTFTYRCPLLWEDLLATDNRKIRYCSTCDRGVYLAESEKKFRKLAKQGRCVAAWCDVQPEPELVVGNPVYPED